jgi:hypothetical protein
MQLAERTIGLGEPRDASKDERLVLQNTIHAHANLYAKLSQNLDSVLPALSSFRNSWVSYKQNISKIAVNATKQAGMPLGFAAVTAVLAAVRAINAAEAAGKGTEKAKEVFAALADSVKYSHAAVQSYQQLTGNDLIRKGIITDQQMNEFAANLEVTPAFVRGFVVLVTRTWASKIGMSYTPADAQFSKMQDSFKIVRERLTSLGRSIHPKKSPAEIQAMLYAPPDLIAKEKELFLGEMKKSYDAAKANQKPPGIAESVFNAIVGTIRDYAGIALFGLAGALFSGTFGLVTESLTANMSHLSFSAARLIQASMEAASAGAAEFARTFKVARIDQKKSAGDAERDAEAAAKKTIAVVGTKAYDDALTDIRNYMNSYKEAVGALEAFGAEFMARLEKLLKWLLIGGVVVGGVVVASKFTGGR